MTGTGERVAGAPPGLVDLAAERLGGKVLLANDEFFAEKENLIRPGRGVFIPDKYTDRGKWMDGWETRRRRTPGHDWCIIRLGLPGVIRKVDIDTNHFIGNHPPHASLDAVPLAMPDERDAGSAAELPWVTILPKSALRPGSQNLFTIVDGRSWTHARLNIYPDGGVARLRLYGTVVPQWRDDSHGGPVDLAAIEHGGSAISCSDMFFSSMNNLIMPGPPVNMGDGWETKRRRGPGYDWIVIKLGAPGEVTKVEVDTTHFKGNYPDTCSLEGCFAGTRTGKPAKSRRTRTSGPAVPGKGWRPLLPRTKLKGDTRHLFESELEPLGAITHVRLNIYPDGGVARLRVWGKIKRD
jgi:allantoicase